MNTFRWNSACKCRRSVCFSAPNLTFIGNRGSVQEPPKSQHLPKIVVFGHWKPTQWTLSDEIRHVSVDVRSALAHQIWPSSVKAGRYRSPQESKFAQNCDFRPPEADTMNTFTWNLACKPSASVSCLPSFISSLPYPINLQHSKMLHGHCCWCGRVLQSCLLLRQCCFDIVAGMDGALRTKKCLSFKSTVLGIKALLW